MATAETPPLRPPQGIPRIRLPAERIDAYIRSSGTKYVAVPRDEFERAAALAGETRTGTADAGTYVREARFTASLSEEGALVGPTLVGRAWLDVGHSSDRWRLLPLAPCTLAIRESEDETGERWPARWVGRSREPSGTGSAASRGETVPLGSRHLPRADLGVGEDGRLGVVVEKPGKLEFGWSLRGRSRKGPADKTDFGGELLTFRLELPPATVRTLELELPARWTPRVSQAAIEPLDPTSKETKRWRIRLPSGPAFELDLADASAAALRPDVTLRQSTAYRLWPHSIDVQVDLSLDVAGGPLTVLDVDLTPGLVLLSANAAGDQPISWSQIGSADSPRVRLQLPQPLSGLKHAIRLEAAAPLRLDKKTTLPAVRPRDVFWQEGIATVWLERSLSLEMFALRDARQSAGLAPQSSGRYSGSGLSVRLLSPEAAIEVAVGRSGPRLEVSQATTVTLGTNELRGRTSAEVTCLEGECSELKVEMGLLWSVETVETTPRDALAGWEERTTDPPSASVVRVRLANPLKAGEAVRLTITGRNASSRVMAQPTVLRWNERQSELLMVAFPDARAAERLWNVEAAPGGSVRLGDSAGVRELAAADLTAAQRRLFDRPPRGLVLAVDVPTPQVEVVAQRSRTGLRAALHAEALVMVAGGVADKLREDYHLECTPQGAALNEVEVRFSQPRTSTLQWSLLVDDNERQLTPVPISPPEGQAWRVRLPYGMSEPFVIRAVHETPLMDRLAIGLPAVPQADHQEGTLSILAEPGTRFLVDNHSLEAVDGPDDEEPPAAALYGRWRFQPERDAALGQAAIALVRDADAPGAAGAIVNHVRLDSYYQPGGGARHRATFQIDNQALSAADLLLPSDVEHVEVRIDGTRIDSVPAPSEEGTAQISTIRLERGRREIQVDYDVPFSGLGMLTTVSAELPRWQSAGTDLPVLECVWRVVSPPGYDVLAVSPWQPLVPHRASWLRRLIGPLAGARDGQHSASEEGPTSADPADTLAAGGPSHTLVGPVDGRPTTRIVHQRTFEAAGWSLFLAVSLGVYCFGPRSGRRMAVATALLVAVALLVPGYYVPLGLGALWGLFAGLALARLWPPGRPGPMPVPDQPGEEHSSLARAGAASAIGLALIVGHSVFGYGGPPSQAAREAVLPVIIPVTTGPQAEAAQVVHVPEGLWDGWRQQRLEASRALPWMIERADYVGRVSAPSASSPVPPPSLTATFGLRTTDARTRVQLDFGAALGPFRPLDALLDGQVIDLDWDAAGRVCALDVPTAGAHALELELRPNVRVDGASWQLEQPVPPVAAATLSLAFPAADAASAEVASAVGSITRSGRGLRGQLGPADRIVVRWQNGATPAQPPRAEVDELLWLRIKAGAVSLRAKWVFNVHRGLLRQFHLAADRRLRLSGDFRDGDGRKVPHEGEPLPAPRTAAGPQVYRLSLDPPRSGRFVVEGEFLVEDTHGIGQLRFPQVKIDDVPIDERRTAASWDADLNADDLVPGGKSRTSIADFLTAWGDQDGKPQAVRDGRADWSLAVRPLALSRAVQQTLWVDYGPRRAEVRFEADVTSAAGPCFHHVLRLPADLVVERLTVSEGNQAREATWTMDAGVLSVFLRDKAASVQRIELVGYVPLGVPGAAGMPAIYFDREQALTTSSQTHISRQPTVRASVVSKTGKKLTSGAAATSKPAPAEQDAAAPSDIARAFPASRFVGAWPTPPGTELRVDLQPNRPRGRSPFLMTALGREADQWLAEVVYDLVVAGELDAVTLVAPSGLGEPTILEPPGRLERQPAGARTRWRYVPAAPLTGAARVALSWRLPASTAQRVEIPEIDLATTTPAERLVALPQAWAEEGWAPEGLTRVHSLDEVLAPLRAKVAKDSSSEQRLRKLRQSLAGFDLYRPPATGAAALLRRPVARQGQVRATDATVDWRLATETAYHGVARFTLATEGPETVKVILPDGSRLLRCAWVAGSSGAGPLGRELPLAASPGEDDHWQISLGPQPTPRVLELTFAGELASPAAGEIHLASPRLVDVPVEATNWTVTLPGQRSVSPPEGAESRVAEGRQVISLTVDGPESYVVDLTARAHDADSLGRRVLVLATLLVGGVGLAWAMGRFHVRRRHRLTPEVSSNLTGSASKHALPSNPDERPAD